MDVSSNTNNYQSLNQQQLQSASKPQNSIQSIPSQDPTYSNKEVYEASQGNIHRNNDGKLAVTPQGETNINNAQEEQAAQSAAEVQANRDSQRESATNVLAKQSQKSQVEIYLAVATEGNQNNPVQNNTAQVIESLRDVQKQNNAVEAYATYRENQNAPANNMARGLVG